MKCSNCGLIINPSIWLPGADAELEAEWFDGEGYQPDRSAWTKMFARWNANTTWRRLEKAGIRSGEVLEIGPGSGATLLFLQSKGYAVHGCDASRAVCDYVSKAHRIPMHHGPVADMPGHRQFDAIVMNHIVEHVSDPVRLLREVKHLVRPGGLVHIAVPNVASWDAKLSGWTSYQPYHLIYYSPATLRSLVERAGFRVTQVETREPFSGWFLATLRTVAGHGLGAPAAGRAASTRSPAIEATYRIAMLTAGAITYPLRVMQAAVGKGEEVIVLATREASTVSTPGKSPSRAD